MHTFSTAQFFFDILSIFGSKQEQITPESHKNMYNWVEWLRPLYVLAYVCVYDTLMNPMCIWTEMIYSGH